MQPELNTRVRCTKMESTPGKNGKGLSAKDNIVKTAWQVLQLITQFATPINLEKLICINLSCDMPFRHGHVDGFKIPPHVLNVFAVLHMY